MVATSTTIPTVTCEGSKSGDFGFQTVPDAKASITAFSLFAPMIQINWQSSDRPQSTTTNPTATQTATSSSSKKRLTASGTQVIDTDATSSPETLILDDNVQTAGGADNIGIGGGSSPPTSTPSLQDNTSSSSPSSSGGFSSGAKVAIGVGGAAAVLMLLVCALFYFWRRRKNRREERELDRPYGVKGTMSAGGDFASSGDIPGWYRGQRPAAPYYKPYRPGA